MGLVELQVIIRYRGQIILGWTFSFFVAERFCCDCEGCGNGVADKCFRV